MGAFANRMRMVGEWLQYPRLLFGLVRTSLGGPLPERIQFGPDSRQYLLAYEPRLPAHGVAVFFLHGGGWRRGRPELFQSIAHFFSRRGYPVALPSYRLAPRHKHPAQVNDAAAAFTAFIHWLDGKGFQNLPIVVGGNSAGAHLAAFLTLDPRFCPAEGHSRIRGLLSLAGPLRWDVPHPDATKPLMRDLIRKVTAWPEADPYLLLQQPQSLRLLAFQGTWDPLITVKAAEDFTRAWSPDGSRAELHVLPRHFHSDVCCDAFLKRCRERTWILAFLSCIESEGLPKETPGGTDCEAADVGLPEQMRKERPNPYL